MYGMFTMFATFHSNTLLALPDELSPVCVVTLMLIKKFGSIVQDHEEMSAMDVADAIADMHARGRYHKLFLMVETCQASTMFAHVRSPNVFMLAASKKGLP
jgi:Peptidase C13 family